MSEFSTVLSRFVKEKDVNVYRLAKYCGMTELNLYKVMRGRAETAESGSFKSAV